MNCADLDRGTLWIDLVLGELPPDVEVEVRQHLQNCRICSEGELEARALVKAMSQLPEGPPLPDDVVAPVLSGAPYPPLPSALEARLLSIPDRASSPSPAGIWIDSIELTLRNMWGKVGYPGATHGRWWIPALAAFAALVVLRTLPDVFQTSDIEKGATEPGSVEARKVEASLNLELVAQSSGAQPERLRLGQLSNGAWGVTADPEQQLVPVLQSPGVALNTHPWHVTVVALYPSGRIEVVVQGDQAVDVPLLPGTGALYAPLTLFQLASAQAEVHPPGSGIFRIFVLLTHAPIPRNTLEGAGALIDPKLSGTPSLLATRALSQTDGFEGTVLVEVR